MAQKGVSQEWERLQSRAAYGNRCGMMKWISFAAAMLFLLATESPAQTGTSVRQVNPAEPGTIAAPASQELLIAELNRRRPDEVSPFFADREVATFVNSAEGRRFIEKQGVPTYPNTASYDSADRMFADFFGGMFRSVRFGPEKPGEMVAVTITPGTSFSLEERREITVTISLTNNGRKLLAIYFPTEQRFDVVIRDSNGAVIERWSDDRAFAKDEAAVMVNPGEKIEYTATISTRDLKGGQTYQLETSLHDNPDYTRVVTLTPF